LQDPVYLDRCGEHPLKTGSRSASQGDMSNRNEELVVKELLELKSLETQLHKKWTRLKRAGKGVRVSFVSSLYELQTRAHQLDQLLDSPKQRAA
jgi:hypothetical protein